MTFMQTHWDAFGVALILIALAIVVFAAMDRAYTRAARARREVHRVLRNLDRRAYWRLHHRYTALCSAGITVEQAAAAEAEQITAYHAPIPYELVDAPAYRPVFTEGTAA